MTDKQEKKLHGTYAEFDAVDPLLAACARIRDAGYTKTDAYTPFPVHGIEKALGIKPTVLPWISLVAGLTGTTIALVMQVWMNTIDYPYIISGKPFFSMPAFIPVSFELTILLASFGAFFGMLALNGLPKLSNPLFNSPRFDRATDDKFFLYIDAKDPRFDHAGVTRLLGELGGEHVHDVYDDDSSTMIPRGLLLAIGAFIFISWIPLLAVARMRVTDSPYPRFHVWFDMDFSPAKGPQMTSSLFADGRWQRGDVPGTVAIGQLTEAPDFYTGIDMERLAQIDSPRANRLVRALLYPDDAEPAAADEPVAAAEPVAVDEPVAAAEAAEPAAAEPAMEAGDTAAADAEAVEPAAEADSAADQAPADEAPADEAPADEAAADEAPADEAAAAGEASAGEAAATGAAAAAVQQPAGGDTTPWLTRNPLELTDEVLRQGQTQFNIYCATCHGVDGAGNGLVNRRAQRILATNWVQPTSLHDETLDQEIYPDGKLFNTITHGIRKMGGYGSQIKVRDRWALVGYVRALQASQNATLADFPENRREALSTQQVEVRERLEQEAAEAERLRQEKAARDAAEEAAGAN